MNTHNLVPAGRGANSAAKLLDTLNHRLIEHAARRAPPILAERLREEWLADLAAQPGAMARLRHALGCQWAATLIDDDYHVASAPAAVSIAGVPIAMTSGRHRVSGFPRSRSDAKNAPAICEMNTTPLIDVLLVLLVTLIMSLPLVTHSVKLDLPAGAAVLRTPPEVINLDIDLDGTIAWNGMAITSNQQLDNYFRATGTKLPQPQVHLRPDPHVKYDLVAKVLAAAERNGVSNLGLENMAALSD